MNRSATRDDFQVTGNRATKTRETRIPSLLLVWAITAGETVLWGALAWLFADYWMMLPVRYRWVGGLVLAGLAAIGFLRLLLFYKRFLRNKQSRKSS